MSIGIDLQQGADQTGILLMVDEGAEEVGRVRQRKSAARKVDERPRCYERLIDGLQLFTDLLCQIVAQLRRRRRLAQLVHDLRTPKLFWKLFRGGHHNERAVLL